MGFIRLWKYIWLYPFPVIVTTKNLDGDPQTWKDVNILVVTGILGRGTIQNPMILYIASILDRW